jgi:DNA-directed RNA polymerase subunit RPC12/RpoP
VLAKGWIEMVWNCDKCNRPATHISRCDVHYACDGCGSTDDLCHYVDGLYCPDCREKIIEERIANFKGNTEFTSNITCPYCGHVITDSCEIRADYDDDWECGDCGNHFIYERHVTIEYSTKQK